MDLCSVADPGCLSRIPDPDFYPSRIQGSKSTQSRIPDPDPQHWICVHFITVMYSSLSLSYPLY